MKRILFITMALLAIVGRASAQNAISCADITVEDGQQIAELEFPIELTNEADLKIVGISFTLTLPDGLDFVIEDDEPLYSLVSSRLNPNRFAVYVAQYSEKSWGFRISTTKATAALNGTEGEFMTLTLSVDGHAPVGENKIWLTENKLSIREDNNNVISLPLDDAYSTLTVTEPLVLDENDGSLEVGTYSKVILKRTFAAGWNTLCLPFAVKDVQGLLGEGAKAYEWRYLNENNEILFGAVSSLGARGAYVVYVPTAITEDIVINGDITIDIESEIPAFGEVSNEAGNRVYLYGTYEPIGAGNWKKKAETDVVYGVTPEGKIAKAGPEASIKGFRAYFVASAGTEVKGFRFDDNPDAIVSPVGNTEETIYNVAGQRLNKVQNGINIVNGKKVLR